MKKVILITILLLLNSQQSFGQSWFKRYNIQSIETDYDYFKSITPLANGNFLLTGNIFNWAGNNKITISEMDGAGTLLWTKMYPIPGSELYSFDHNVVQTSASTYVLKGTITMANDFNYSNPQEDAFYFAYTATGDSLWYKSFSSGPDYINECSDNAFFINGYIVSFSYDRGFSIPDQVRSDTITMTSLNLDGELNWVNSHGVNGADTTYIRGSKAVELSSGDFLIYSPIMENYDTGELTALLTKMNAVGDTLWSRRTAGSTLYQPGFIERNDTLIISTYLRLPIPGTYYYPAIIRLNSLGDSIDTKECLGGIVTEINDFATSSLLETADNGFLVVFNQDLYTPLSSQVYKYDQYWNEEWRIDFDENTFGSGIILKQVIELENGDFIGVGSDDDLKTAFAVRFKPDGQYVLNTIEGNIFNDENLDCLKDVSESFFSNVSFVNNWKIKFKEQGSLEESVYYSINDTNGYRINVPNGDYEVSLIPPNSNWITNCTSSAFESFSFSGPGAKITHDFAVKPSNSCAHLTVDIGTSEINPCFRNTYSVKYCNEGTQAESASIAIEFDDNIVPLSSTVAWTAQGNTYTFDVGTVGIGECGRFYLTDSISCLTPIGSVNCARATISPNLNCEILDNSWDKSSVSVTGECQGDSSVCFTILNTGDAPEGDMMAPSEYRIYENNALAFTGNFQLNGQESIEICWLSNGNTVRLEADQRPGHPGNSHPRETIENCGQGGTPGYALQVPEDDLDPFIAEFCLAATSSHDPNDKSVFPAGITENHNISLSTYHLSYHINFQNTGDDTTHWVIVRDTISPYLNLESFKAGASSHDYRVEMLDNRVVEFRFEDLKLVDSLTNEEESKGWVQFEIDRDTALAEGTIISNNAGIIFDYNAPIITNSAFVILSDTVLTLSNLSLYKLQLSVLQTKVYPSPFSNLLIIEGSQLQSCFIYDQVGRQLIHYNLSNNLESVNTCHLPAGTYFVKVTCRKGNNPEIHRVIKFE
jgi:hypothetical protein